ncbi:MAG TPA: glycosyltransferase [Blastocatellia bacterium]|nr:glycosyltransferase [Blastocatellia bacterium]
MSVIRAVSPSKLNACAPLKITPMRLCFIADPRSIHTARWIRFFAERGHSVALISHCTPEPGLGIDRHYAISEESIRGTRLIKNALEVRKAVRDFRAQILHAHYINESGWLAALSGVRPFVLTAWGSDVYLAPTQSRLARVLTPWTVRRAGYVTADSMDQVARLCAMGRSTDTTEMVTWGVDLDRFTGRDGMIWRTKNSIEPDQIVILSPRQWIDNSNIEVILEAFSLARATQPRALLVLKRMTDTGSAIREQLEARIQALGIADSTLIVGEMPEHELADMYAGADVTVSVCASDGTPVSVLEAMAGESALVVSNLPSLAEWIEPDVSGLLVQPGDVQQLCQSLLRLSEDVALRSLVGKNARRVVEERADRRVNLQKVEAIYHELVSAA